MTGPARVSPTTLGAPAGDQGRPATAEATPETRKGASPVQTDQAARTCPVVSVRDAAACERYIASWELLADHAAEPNPFYEHWMLLPALRLYGAGQDVEIALVVETDAAGEARVVGVFPLQRLRRFRGLPLRAATLWEHPHCFLCTPLLSRGREADCWRALFAWRKTTGKGEALLDLQTLSADGPVFRSLLDVVARDKMPVHVSGLYTRAMMQVGRDAESYLRESMTKGELGNYERKRRRMSESGTLETRWLTQSDPIEAWMERFLSLEASGWKGRTGTAIACNEADREFFSEIAREGFRRQRLRMVSMSLDGAPVAGEFNIVAGEGIFSLKIAYDERHARFSPGMVLAIEGVRRVHQQSHIRWIDSCAAPGDHPMKRLWGQRRMIASVICPTGGWFSRLLVGLIPLGRSLRGWRTSDGTTGEASAT